MSNPVITDRDWLSARELVGNGLLSVIMPAYNLGTTIAQNLRVVHELLEGKLAFELIVVDDGSTDDTRAAILNVRGSLPKLRMVLLDRNAGKGHALRMGFDESRGSHIILLDADLDLPPWQIARLFARMKEAGTDIVIGSKRHPDSELSYPWRRQLMSNVYYLLIKLLFGMPLRDTQTGIKLFKRQALEWTFPRMLVKQFAFDIELLAIAHERGFKIAEVPVRLQFKSVMGAASTHAVKQIMMDTMAVFYRLRLLRYYQNIQHTRMPESPPLVSIVIAYPAPTEYLTECIAGIRTQTCSNYEIILLPDEASGRLWPAPIREIATGRLRPADKRNIGIRHAKGAVVAFLDDDTIPLEQWLEHAMVYFSDETVAAVGGPASTPPTDGLMAKMSGRVFAHPLVSGSYRYRYTPNRVREIDDFPSCNLLVRTDALQAAGGFRTDFWPGEDTYLCMEIVHRLGKRIFYDPRVHVWHHRRRLFLPHLRQVGRYALHRGYFARRFPATSRRVAYFVPSLFVTGVLFGAVAAGFIPALRLPYAATLIAYGVCVIGSSFSRHPLPWALTALGIAATHAVYGVRFLMGFMTRKMPGEVARFDHPSERAPT